MKTHYCPVDKAYLSFEDECNWCGLKESPHVAVISDHLAWVARVIVVIVVFGCAVAFSFIVGKLI